MSNQYLPRDIKLKKRATELRTNATKEENKLRYEYLRTYPVRFNRQRIIGEYIAGFYCSRAKLVIELDGALHNGVKAEGYDFSRTQYMEKIDLKVFRITNSDIFYNFKDVCMAIDAEVKRCMKNFALLE